MITLLPGTSPEDTRGLSLLIALILDADAAKKRLAELQAETDRANAATTEANDLVARAKEEAAALVVERESIEAEKAKLAAAHDDLAKRDAALTKRAAGIEKNEQDNKQAHDKSMADLDVAAAALALHEAKVMDRENAVAAIQTVIEPQKADLDRRLKLLRAAQE